MSYLIRAIARDDGACPVQHARPFNNPAQNYEQSSVFIAAIGAASEPLNFRAIHDQNKALPAIKRRGTLEQYWQELCEWNNKGYGIFVTISAMDGAGYEASGHPITGQSGDKLENVAAIRAHYIDLDDLSAMQDLQRAASHVPPPQFYVQTSPNKAHVYWVLGPQDRYKDGNWFSQNQAKLAQLYNGDPRIADPTRVLRLPGFLHLKGAPHLVTCAALPGRDCPTMPGALAASLAHVNVIRHNTGTRRALGDPDLAAPGLEWVDFAFRTADPNEMDRAQWISFTAAIKQAMWTLVDPDGAFARWSAWCERYAANDPGENLKQWNDLTDTQIGWRWIEREYPQIAAHRLLGGTQLQHSAALPMPETQSSDKSFLDDGSGIPFDRLVSTEIYKIFRSTGLPVAWNEFTRKIVKRDAMPWPSNGEEWSEVDDAYAGAFLQGIRGREATDKALREAVLLIADKNAYNPVTDWLNAIKWDGNPRLDGLLPNYFSTDPAEGNWARVVGPKFLIGMVARALNPGCKRDEILILQGPQGINKSSALAVLAGDEYFSDSLPNMHDKEASEHISGLWLIEVSEMAKILRGNQEDVKGFLARKNEKYRPAYGRHTVTQPRQCVFAGTTNADQYLNDPTGERRYWPVKCVGKIDLDGLTRDREQLFAEAVLRYRLREPYWLSTPEELSLADQITSDRTEHDPWQDRIERYCAGFQRQAITMETLFVACIGIPFDRQNRRETGRVARILTRLGYERKQFRQPDGSRTWGYVKE